MNKQFDAKIKWLTKEEGGRSTIPKGDKYAPIIVLKGNLLDLNKQNWSVFVRNNKFLNSTETLSQISYLSDLAPNNLTSKIEFYLYEGTSLVAKGQIL